VGVVRVPVVHEFDLAEVDGLDSHIDPAFADVNEPHARFQPAHVRDGCAFSPVIDPAPERVEHLLVAEIPRLGLQTELLENGRRDRDLVHIGGDAADDRADDPLRGSKGQAIHGDSKHRDGRALTAPFARVRRGRMGAGGRGRIPFIGTI